MRVNKPPNITTARSIVRHYVMWRRAKKRVHARASTMRTRWREKEFRFSSDWLSHIRVTTIAHSQSPEQRMSKRKHYAFPMPLISIQVHGGLRTHTMTQFDAIAKFMRHFLLSHSLSLSYSLIGRLIFFSQFHSIAEFKWTWLKLDHD